MKTIKNKIYNLTAKEAFELLQSDMMANYKTNIQFNKPTHGGNNHGGRKSGSKNKMPAWFQAFIDNQFNPFVVKQEQFNQYVLDVLEKHNLALNHIEDVLKRNNLK